MTEHTQDASPQGVRIAKYLAHMGFGSRRQMEREIDCGTITINGTVITTPAVCVTAQDVVTVKGVRVRPSSPAPRLFRYAKPPGLLVSHGDPQGRPTVFDHLPPHLPRLISVGRLDLNSQGLLLLTTSGPLARTLEHPSTTLKRVYRVRVWGKVEMSKLSQLAQGITIDGIRYSPVEVSPETPLPPAHPSAPCPENTWLRVVLWEGKNREIRKIMGHFGLEVSRLIRVAYGPFELGALNPGEVREIPPQEFEMFVGSRI